MEFINIFKESPMSVIKSINSFVKENNDILGKAYRIADLYDNDTKTMWYLLIAWFFDCKNEVSNTKKTLDGLFKKQLVSILKYGDIVNFLVYSLYDNHKDKIIKIFDYLSNDRIYDICSIFIRNNNLKIGLEILGYIKNNRNKIDK